MRDRKERIDELTKENQEIIAGLGDKARELAELRAELAGKKKK